MEMREIRISKAARRCHATERPFSHGDEVTSLVRVDEQQLIREDYSKEAWEPLRSEHAIAVWTTRFVDPEIEQQQPPEVFSPLRQLFYEAVESEDRKELAKVYLAAQLLRRQKVFRLVKESDDEDGEVRIALFADRIDNRLVEVRDPNLSYSELEEGRQALVQRLAELETPEGVKESDEMNTNTEPTTVMERPLQGTDEEPAPNPPSDDMLNRPEQDLRDEASDDSDDEFDSDSDDEFGDDDEELDEDSDDEDDDGFEDDDEEDDDDEEYGDEDDEE